MATTSATDVAALRFDRVRTINDCIGRATATAAVGIPSTVAAVVILVATKRASTSATGTSCRPAAAVCVGIDGQLAMDVSQAVASDSSIAGRATDASRPNIEINSADSWGQTAKDDATIAAASPAG
jgi:hypothetical protein